MTNSYFAIYTTDKAGNAALREATRGRPGRPEDPTDPAPRAVR